MVTNLLKVFDVLDDANLIKLINYILSKQKFLQECTGIIMLNPVSLTILDEENIHKKRFFLYQVYAKITMFLGENLCYQNHLKKKVNKYICIHFQFLISIKIYHAIIFINMINFLIFSSLHFLFFFIFCI